MKILLIQDEKIELDLKKIASILNNICTNVKFQGINDPINLESQLEYIMIEDELKILQREISDIKRDYTMYLTHRMYNDNYFAHSKKNIMFVSFSGWGHYTSLPLENGLLYWIADILALKVDRSFRHDDITGCIYDKLGYKPGIDLGLKMAFICEKCMMRIDEKVKDSKKEMGLILDTIEILNLLSNASKWGKSVFDIDKDQGIYYLNWSTFEDEVAQFYRELGANVKQNLNISGFQIDIYLEEETPSKQIIRTIVECKFHKSKVGNRIVNEFYRVLQTLKEADQVDKGIIISSSGFSKDASLVSKSTGIELLHFKDIKQKVMNKIPQKKEKIKKSTEKRIEEKEMEIKQREEKSPDIFVIMPFSTDFDDIYHLGIHEIAKSMNRTCERVDEIEFVGSILDKIYSSIEHSNIIVAEVSNPNPNVYYELGYAHALRKPVILVTKNISSTPFDIKGFNHIAYENIMDLRKKLKKRLETILANP